jgi:hypothetical protein
MTAKVKTNNQEFPIPDDWVALADDSQEAKNQRDTRLRRLLASYVPAVTNAQLSYTTEGDETIVRVTPQLGTKGVEELSAAQPLPSFFFLSGLHCDLAPVHEALRDAPPHMPPVLKLAWELKWAMITGRLTFQRLLDYQPQIQQVLQRHGEESLVEHIHERLKGLPSLKSPAVPIGF